MTNHVDTLTRPEPRSGDSRPWKNNAGDEESLDWLFFVAFASGLTYGVLLVLLLKG